MSKKKLLRLPRPSKTMSYFTSHDCGGIDGSSNRQAIIAESSHLIDMGAGVGMVMWHAGVAACAAKPPDGVEHNPVLVKIAERIASEVIRKAPDGAVWEGWPSKQVAVQDLLAGWIGFLLSSFSPLISACQWDMQAPAAWPTPEEETMWCAMS